MEEIEKLFRRRYPQSLLHLFGQWHAQHHIFVGCPTGQTGPCSVLKHFESDDSVFIDDAYLVKGVPGRILRKIACAYLSEGRCEFSNKEIRLDSSLQLPDFKDNLETRLILLRRRIEERCDFLQIVPIARGRFRFDVKRRLKLESLP